MRLHNLVKSTEGTYNVVKQNVSEEDIIKMAKSLTASKMRKGSAFTHPTMVSDYLVSHFGDEEVEKFGVILLDNQHKVISKKVLFTGTINAAPVYPREVLKLVLTENAAAVILFHNHPSGDPDPSLADKTVTKKLKDALEQIDVSVLDHFIVCGSETTSFAQRGLI